MKFNYSPGNVLIISFSFAIALLSSEVHWSGDHLSRQAFNINVEVCWDSERSAILDLEICQLLYPSAVIYIHLYPSKTINNQP